MPAITVENPLTLAQLARPSLEPGSVRPVLQVVSSHQQTEGAGFGYGDRSPARFPWPPSTRSSSSTRPGPR
jgi:hypothetical protein